MHCRKEQPHFRVIDKWSLLGLFVHHCCYCIGQSFCVHRVGLTVCVHRVGLCIIVVTALTSPSLPTGCVTCPTTSGGSSCPLPRRRRRSPPCTPAFLSVWSDEQWSVTFFCAVKWPCFLCGLQPVLYSCFVLLAAKTINRRSKNTTAKGGPAYRSGLLLF